MSEPKKIGGEIGEVRASINIANLDAYIEKHVPAIRAPVTVKQFKVRIHWFCSAKCSLSSADSLVRCVVRSCLEEPHEMKRYYD